MRSSSTRTFGSAAFALAATGLALFLVALAPACSSDDAAATGDDASASTGSADAGTCDPVNARNGAPCFPIAPIKCFTICNNVGGCVCKRDPSGADAGIWECTPTDTSCLPDSAPIDEFDASEPLLPDAATDDDAGADDAGLDAGADADADAG